MKAIITGVHYSSSGQIIAGALYFNGTTLQDVRYEVVTVSAIQADGIIKAVVDVVIAYSTSQAWGMTEADIATYQSKNAPTTADAGKYLKGDGTWGAIAGGGDIVGPVVSVASQIALFDGITGKLLKADATTGVLKATAGVIGAAVGDTDYALPSTVALKAPLASPTLTTPVLGVATATTINKVTVTQPATNATLTIAEGVTLTASANATVSGTNSGDNTNFAAPLGADDNYATDAEKTKLANLSGVNTGDQTLPVKATAAEVDTGTDDAKFVTALAMEGSLYIKQAAADAKVADAINDGTTTVAPSQNAVFDALALKGRANVYNASVAVQGAGFATDTYLVGSSCAIPASSLQAKSMYRCVFNVKKTAAGTATAIINIRVGTNGSTADTSRGTLTFTAGTAAADEGKVEVWATFRTVGSGTTAVLQTLAQFTHKLSVTGLTGTAAVSEPEIATSGGFDSTVANSIIGLSVNGGASAAWTVQLVQAELFNLI